MCSVGVCVFFFWGGGGRIGVGGGLTHNRVCLCNDECSARHRVICCVHKNYQTFISLSDCDDEFFRTLLNLSAQLFMLVFMSENITGGIGEANFQVVLRSFSPGQ